MPVSVVPQVSFALHVRPSSPSRDTTPSRSPSNATEAAELAKVMIETNAITVFFTLKRPVQESRLQLSLGFVARRHGAVGKYPFEIYGDSINFRVSEGVSVFFDTAIGESFEY